MEKRIGIRGYKAFESDMTCRGKQYAENTVYEESEAKLCEKGMHFCENPFDLLNFYPLVAGNGDLITTAEVESQGKTETDGVKSVTTKLRIGAKLNFAAFIKACVDFLTEEMNKAKIGSSGDWAQIGSAGDGAKIGSSGYKAKIGSSGDGAQIGSAGDWAQIGSSGDWAQIGSSGDKAQIGSAGDWAKIVSKGRNSVIVCAGNGSAASARAGSWITLAEWAIINGEFEPVCVKTEYVDGERIKADTLYELKNGEFIEV